MGVAKCGGECSCSQDQRPFVEELRMTHDACMRGVRMNAYMIEDG